MFKLLKTFTTACLTTVLVWGLTLAPLSMNPLAPKETEAIFGGGLSGVATEVTQLAHTAANVAHLTIEEVLDQIVWRLANQIKQMLIQELLRWIDSGFAGRPAFVSDLSGFLLDLGDQIVGDFIWGNETLAFLCSPFELNVKIALQVHYEQNRRNPYQAQCRLSEVADNIDNFLAGDFSSGGWQGWFELTTRPENTPFGAYFEAQAALNSRVDGAEERELAQLGWSDGFFSFKVCEGGEVEFSSADADPAVTGANNARNCTVTTPGNAIAHALNFKLELGERRLLEADEIAEILDAVFFQLANRVLTGARGLLGATSGSRPDPFFTTPIQPLPGNDENLAQFNLRLEFEQAVLSRYQAIANPISVVRTEYENGRAQFSERQLQQCNWGLEFDEELADWFNMATAGAAAVQGRINQIQGLRTQFTNASTPVEQSNILAQLGNLPASTREEGRELEDLLDFEVRPKIESFRETLDEEVARCEAVISR